MKNIFLTTFLLITTLAMGQVKKVTLVSNNTISISGIGALPMNVQFTNAAGQWFVNGNDVFFKVTLSGSYKGRDISIDLQSNSNNKLISIARDANLRFKNNENFDLIVGREDHSGDYICEPEGDDAVQVTVNTLNNTTINLSFEGKVTYNDVQNGGFYKVIISGAVSLTQKVNPAIAKAAESHPTGNCDNAIYDKTPGAEGRSATDCEIQFDHKVRQAIAEAMAPVVIGFTNGWDIESQTPVKTINTIGRGSEKNFYTLDQTDVGSYKLSFSIDQSNPDFATMMQKMKNAMPKTVDANSMKNYREALSEMGAAESINIEVMINCRPLTIVNFQPVYSKLQFAGVSQAINARYAQAPTGGDGGSETTFVCIGNWGGPQIKNYPGGSQHITIPVTINSAAPHLSIQNICIRIVCNKDLAQKVIGLIDLEKLDDLITIIDVD